MINDKGIRNALLLAIVVIGFSLVTGLFHGTKTETWTIPAAKTLFIATPCASEVTINADPSLQGEIQVVAKARTKDQIMQLQSRGGASAFLSGAGSHCLGASACMESQTECAGQPDDPNLALTLTIPTGLALNITEGQNADYTIGDINAPLSLNISGKGDVTAGAITSLNADIAGPITATLSKNGDLDAANVNAPTANLTLNGNGDVDIDDGNLGTLDATLSDSGDLHAPAAQAATLIQSADGDAELGTVSGNLAATLTGDGDLSVGSVGGNAAIRSTDDGNVTIPHVTGHLTQSNTGDGAFKINGG